MNELSVDIRLVALRELTVSHTQRHTVTVSRSHSVKHTHTHKQTHTHTNRHTDTQTHRHTDTQTHRHTDTQTHRHTDTQRPSNKGRRVVHRAFAAREPPGGGARTSVTTTPPSLRAAAAAQLGPRTVFVDARGYLRRQRRGARCERRVTKLVEQTREVIQLDTARAVLALVRPHTVAGGGSSPWLLLTTGTRYRGC